MTMGELGEQLQASSGAISGAVKMLTSVGLVERVPAPASRRDHYRLRDDAWAVLYTNQNEVTSADARPPRPGSPPPATAAWPANGSPRCATSTTSCSTRSRHYWTAGTRDSVRAPAAGRRHRRVTDEPRRDRRNGDIYSGLCAETPVWARGLLNGSALRRTRRGASAGMSRTPATPRRRSRDRGTARRRVRMTPPRNRCEPPGAPLRRPAGR